MKKALVLTLVGLLLFAGAAWADIQAGYDPDDDGDRMRYGDGNELIFGGVASLRWEDGDANANYLLLEMPAGGATDVPVFGIGIALDDEDLGDFNGTTQSVFFVGDADGDSEVYLSFSADDVGLMAGKGSATSMGFTFATMTHTASTTVINYTPAYVIGYDSGAAMTVTTSDTTGNVAITHAGSTKAVTWTAAGGFSFVGDFAVTGAISGTSITGYAIGTDVQAYDAELDDLSGLTWADDYMIIGTGAGTIATASCTAFAQSILDDADEATFKATVNLEIGTDVQAYDAELAAVAALTYADDKIILGTGAGTIATADCSAFAQTVLDDADEATFKATVNLEIGTDVQAYDADLSALAGVTSAANTIPYFTGVGTAGAITSSANIVSWLASADYATARTNLGVAIGTDVQAYDAELAALAGLTSAANTLLSFSGTGTAATITSSANILSWLASADYATARTNLGVAIGSDVEAYDAGLANLAALTMAANEFYYTSADNTHQTASVTAFARSILDDDAEATFKATVNLEIGTDVQAQDDELTDIAGLTFADDKFILGTGAGTIAMADCTAFAQSILDDADEGTFKATVNLEADVDFNAYDADLTTYAGITPSATAQVALQYANNSVVLNHRHRVTVAEINAGHELLPAVSGKSYRIIEVLAIAYGGAVGTTATVDILGTQSAGSVKLVAYAQAGLTQSAVLVSGGTNAAVQADGASYGACDVTTAITIGKTGSDADTATGVDIVITYVLE